jgi:malate dehydrogenase (oxaloacetate-decarboxylating)(NADP+)
MNMFYLFSYFNMKNYLSIISLFLAITTIISVFIFFKNKKSTNKNIDKIKKEIDLIKNQKEKYIYLNKVYKSYPNLYFEIIKQDLETFLPIIYAPGIGEICLNFHNLNIFHKGIIISLKDKGNIENKLKKLNTKNLSIICITNGARILSFGDIGTNGMGIVISKSNLYTACAEIPEDFILPVTIDVGTNNEQLAKEINYEGIKEKRCNKEIFFDLLNEFINASIKIFPNCCIHFEDFAGPEALEILEKYKDKICCFNDDIQGTAGAVLAGIFNACKIKKTNFTDESYLFLGAGAASIGIANLIVKELINCGIKEEEAIKKIHMFDSKGLIESSRQNISNFQRKYAQNETPIKTENFKEAINKFKPTILIGASTVKNAFNKEIIENMANINEKPIIFSLSNPIENTECTAEMAYKYSNGKAIFASGVQFSPIKINNKTFYPGQANNSFIFPGLGLTIFKIKPKTVTDKMFISAAKTLSENTSIEDIQKEKIYPSQSILNKISINIFNNISKNKY